MNQHYADLLCLSELFLAFVFVLSGTAKLATWRRFRDTLSALEILPHWSIGGIATFLPPAEITLGLAVFSNYQPALFRSLLAAFLGCFVLVLSLYRWRGGKELACGCFADYMSKTGTVTLIVRNVLLLAAGLSLLLPHERSLEQWRGEEWFMAASVVLGLLLVWKLTDRLAQTVIDLARAW